VKLVLIDLDNTLIDFNYRLTVPKEIFCEEVRELSNQDVCLGLCSDSAVITLRYWADYLAIKGPIVAERGAVIWTLPQGEKIMNPGETNWLREFRDYFVTAVTRNFPDSTVMIGDATRIVKEGCIGAPFMQKIFVINSFRVASFSFFACKFRSVLEPDPELLKQASTVVSKTLAKYGKNKKGLFWDENPLSGVLIVHVSTTGKGMGVSELVNQLKPEQTVMIGDSMSDFLDLPYVTQYAVGNASLDYKSRASFVASRPLTEGVIECLQNVCKGG